MPKAASARSTGRQAAARGGAPSAAATAVVDSLAPLLRAWLPRQRWFAGKGRTLTGLVPVAVTELLPPVPSGGEGPGLLHLLLRVEQHDGQPPVGAAAAGDCYQLLLGVRTSLPPHLEPSLIGHATEGPLAGRTVYDALHDPYLAGVVMDRLRSVDAVGPLRFGRAGRIPAGLAPRLLGAEQSNSSLVYGDAYILKILRRVVPGPHPDLELPLALAAEGCARVPAPVAWFEAADPAGSGEPLTLGVVQPFLRGSTDGWQLALAALDGGQEFVAEAAELGRATAEVHLALASALPTVTLDGGRTAQLAEAMSRRLDTAAQAVPALQPYAPGLRAAFEALGGLDAAERVRPAQRVHGDLHLGQTLRSPDGSWSVIDFEGEPARPLAERRRPQPPVRDVAGMLRSFDYAARSREPWRADWAARCRDAYCEGYARAAGTDPRSEPELLRAYETDKAVYEVLYEARHRPDWLPVPMAAIERLAAER
ncbi:maltokinase N-terminal cap-like domain-containing protein [Streptomyces montanisoli]|uniref:Maltokinase n=1 Tax=Streptomyces montanisoli TaxID=2798581 RepID=A0A940RWV0_9ACTN|nr:phosphotransferase [Streptomyces montanisoli]MBP0456969.1 phosphotransferase [Streptomyces montanisoli]